MLKKISHIKLKTKNPPYRRPYRRKSRISDFLQIRETTYFFGHQTLFLCYENKIVSNASQLESFTSTKDIFRRMIASNEEEQHRLKRLVNCHLIGLRIMKNFTRCAQVY